MNTENQQQDLWDLCVVGAGIGGLNALYAATEYLPGDARVLLIDKHANVGGMWNTTYDHVRLHQPYEFFTAGDIEWQLGRERSHLASRFEVLEHLRHCLSVIRQRCELRTMFGSTYEGHEEVAGARGVPVARVAVTDASGQRVEVMARRFVKALGFNAQPHEPLTVSSQRVRSTTPESWDFLGEEMSTDGKPIYIIGGGKTGADAAYQAAKRYPDRSIHLITGAGVSFFNRDTTFPTGARRYTGGTSLLGKLADLALRYDGENQDEVYDYFVARHGLEFEGIQTERCIFGLLSPEEKRVIDTNVHVRNGYFEDAVDAEDGTIVMTFRGGEQQPIEPGSWIANCTGTLLKQPLEPEPCLSPGGAILTITHTAGFAFLTHISGYTLTHLWMRGRLAEAPLWLMNLHALDQTDRRNFLVTGSAQVVYNVLITLGMLDTKTMLRCLPTAENWYPTYRVLWMFGLLMARRRRILARLRRSLESFDERHPLRRPVVGEVPASLTRSLRAQPARPAREAGTLSS